MAPQRDLARSDRTRVAVVGTGSIGSRHLRILREVPDVVPIAISRRPSRLRELAAEGYETADDLAAAAQKGANLCVIATESAKHVDDALAAAQCGLDLLVEKPLGLDAREAKRICAASAKAGRRLHVGCTLRFAESLNTFRHLLINIGKIHSVRVECQSYLPEWRPDRSYKESYSSMSQGGVLRDLIHEVDYTGWIFGWPHSVQGSVRNLGRLDIAAEEMADLMWEISGGPVISMKLDYLTRPSRRSMTAAGEFGTLTWNGITGTVTLCLVDSPAKTVQSSETRDDVLRNQDLSFIQSQNGAVDLRLATGTDGVRALAVCDAAREASHSKREEKVQYD